MFHFPLGGSASPGQDNLKTIEEHTTPNAIWTGEWQNRIGCRFSQSSSSLIRLFLVIIEPLTNLMLPRRCRNFFLALRQRRFLPSSTVTVSLNLKPKPYQLNFSLSLEILG